MYLAYRFAPVVDGFKSVTSYHAGDGVWVEFDVLMDEKTQLHHSHDVAETLQYCCEGLGEVDRAFVTTDCEWMDVRTLCDCTNLNHRHFSGSYRTRLGRRAHLIEDHDRLIACSPDTSVSRGPGTVQYIERHPLLHSIA